MVSSLYKRWSTIIRLIPCSTTSAEILFPTIKKAICDIELCGLKVQVLCTDNYPLNVSIFKLFSSDKTLSPSVPHPCDSNRTLFLLFDFVHTLKSIRNNWLNLKDSIKRFNILSLIILPPKTSHHSKMYVCSTVRPTQYTFISPASYGEILLAF